MSCGFINKQELSQKFVCVRQVMAISDRRQSKQVSLQREKKTSLLNDTGSFQRCCTQTSYTHSKMFLLVLTTVLSDWIHCFGQCRQPDVSGKGKHKYLRPVGCTALEKRPLALYHQAHKNTSPESLIML